jgi:hypothetical protein
LIKDINSGKYLRDNPKTEIFVKQRDVSSKVITEYLNSLPKEERAKEQ